MKSVPPNYPLVIGYDFEPTNTALSKKCQSNFNLKPGFLEEKQDVYDESCSFLIPNHTKAFVLEWDTGFEPPGNSKNNKQIDASKVRILQGLRKDQIIYVPNVYISFE
ncbi:MAG: hypothetical protein QNJ72_35465 [Pleurocapsa sp. MO_226.B13]|nr:hypothetical protein [Pleurocapsa sp. MO_226.B13]